MIWKSNSLFFEHPDIFGISFDSRFVKPGDMFIALKGGRVDGHDFVEEALKKGAVCALVEKYICFNNIVVDSCLETFIKIAKFRRSLFKKKEKKVIAITGSVGKSTMRASIVSSLREKYIVDTPIGNFNTLIGLSHFFSQCDLSADFLVVEAGISEVGEMKHLAELIEPEISVLTTITSGHSDTLGSFYKILLEKSKLFDKTTDHAIFCGDLWYSNFLSQLMSQLSLNYSEFDFDPNSRYLMHNIAAVLFKVLSFDGQFNIAEISGRRKIISGFYHENKIDLIDSSYNANFASMIDELKNFHDLQGDQKKILILGDMAGYSARHHVVLSYHINCECWLIGEKMQALSLVLQNSHYFSCFDLLQAHVKNYLKNVHTHCIFLIKGSHCMQLHKLIELFQFNTLTGISF